MSLVLVLEAGVLTTSTKNQESDHLIMIVLSENALVWILDKRPMAKICARHKVFTVNTSLCTNSSSYLCKVKFRFGYLDLQKLQYTQYK